MKSTVGAIAMLGLSVSLAHAADLSSKVYTKAPVAVSPAYDWSGFYIGIHGGGGWAGQSGIYDLGGGPAPIDWADLGNNVSLIGGQAGLNVQRGDVVFGIEGDGSSVFHNGGKLYGGNTTLSAGVESLYSVRGRLGVARDNWLVFGTAGWGQVGYSVGANNPPNVGAYEKETFSRSGAVVGGGVEYGWGQFSFRADYLHYFTGFTHDFAASELTDSDLGDFIKFKDVDVIRASVNWRLPYKL